MNINRSNPDDTTMFLDEANTAQQYADELKAQGVDRVILLSHYGYDNDLALAQNTSGIDIIVGGDSHSLLGDLSDLGLKPSGSYPTMVSDASGNDVCVVTAWQYSQIVGELHAEFDGQGNITSCMGTPHMMLADSFKEKMLTGKELKLKMATAMQFIMSSKSTRPYRLLSRMQMHKR